jgi:hypothetical protein
VAAEATSAMAPAVTPAAGEAKEAAIVRGMVEHLARLDEAGKLAGLFAPAKAAPAEVVETAQNEEGWTLGV